jgi:hypothetical protein
MDALAEGGIVDDEVRRLVDHALERQGLASPRGASLAPDAAKVAMAAYRVGRDRYDGTSAATNPARLDRPPARGADGVRMGGPALR